MGVRVRIKALIGPLRPVEGLWRHASDSEGTIRRSARPEFW